MPSSSVPSNSDAPRLAIVSQPDGPTGPYRFAWPSEGLTSFVGREEALAATAALLTQDPVRLLTLTGPGGVGKTRLAIRLSEVLAPAFRDGVVFVVLSSITDPALLADAIGRALGIRESGGPPLDERIRRTLDTRELLLVLDNFEQIVSAAPEIANLLGSCPSIKVLVTSRAPLRLAGEFEYPVQPLTLPDEAMISIEELSAVPSVALFVHRARAVKNDFDLRDSNAEAVAAVCRRVDGLPLAIELAAARSKVLSPTALLARLGSSLELLTGGPQDQPARLQTLRAAIAWSYDLLSPDEQAVFSRLAVFEGGFSMDAAEAISAADAGEAQFPSAPPVLDALTSLVDSSLLRAYEAFAGEPRFGMLGTVREFGRERLAASGDEEAVRRRHAAFYLAFSEAAVDDLYGGPRQNGALDRLELEHRNIRAALAWAEHARDTEMMQRFVGSLFWFWFVRGHATEARSWARRALAGEGATPGVIRARAMLGAGMLAHAQRDTVEPEQLIKSSLEMFRQAGDSGGEIFALSELGVVAEDRGDYDRAVAYYETALELYRTTGERSPLNIIMALVYAHLGVAVWGQGDIDRAITVWEEALERHRQLEDRWGVANVLEYLALAACEQGDLDRAARVQRESLEMFLDLSSVVDVVDGVYNTATIAGYRGDARVALRLFGAADALNAAFLRAPAYPERLVYDRVREAAAAAVGPDTFTALYREGSALSLKQAAEEALAALAPAEAPVPVEASRAGHDLTAREIEVLALLVVGQTDREIADALFISPRTAQGHVGRIYDKLGVSSRSAAVATALGAGIVPAPASRQNFQR